MPSAKIPSRVLPSLFMYISNVFNNLNAESVLEEIVETIDAKSRLSEERDKFIEDMQNQIQYLQSSLYSTKVCLILFISL